MGQKAIAAHTYLEIEQVNKSFARVVMVDLQSWSAKVYNVGLNNIKCAFDL